VRLNTRGRYGLQLMSQLASHLDDASPVGLKVIARATGLPWRYLEQIAGPLRKAALIKGRPGRAGGYRLGRTPSKITLREVMEVTTGPLRLMDCVDKPETCAKSNKCTSRAMWVNLTGELRGVLDRYTLDDLADRPCVGCRVTAARARGTREASKPPARGRGESKRWKYMRSPE
jgi:Rrf2 family transcriptional regulator, cysteine metabolism repressor